MSNNTMPIPPNDSYPTTLARAAHEYLEHGHASGAQALSGIAGQLWWGMPNEYRIHGTRRRRATSTSALRTRSVRACAQIFQRDRFTCRYCGAPTVLRSFVALLSSLYPAELPYHVHYKNGATHPVYWTRCAEADHLIAGASGGDWASESNIVTACVLCNTRKSSHDAIGDLGWTLKPNTNVGWDGLTSLYLPVWHKAGKPSPSTHLPWLRALDLT